MSRVNRMTPVTGCPVCHLWSRNLVTIKHVLVINEGSRWKWTVLGESGRSKAPKVDGPGLKWTVQNDIKWTAQITKVGGPQKWNWTAVKSAWVVKKGWKWTVLKSALVLKRDESGRSANVRWWLKRMYVDGSNRLKMDSSNKDRGKFYMKVKVTSN